MWFTNIILWGFLINTNLRHRTICIFLVWGSKPIQNQIEVSQLNSASMAFLKNTEINTITEGTQVDFPRTQEVQWRPLFKKKKKCPGGLPKLWTTNKFNMGKCIFPKFTFWFYWQLWDSMRKSPVKSVRDISNASWLLTGMFREHAAPPLLFLSPILSARQME